MLMMFLHSIQEIVLLSLQVLVSVNDVPSLCTGDCTFMWSVDRTPTLTSRDPCCGQYL